MKLTGFLRNGSFGNKKILYRIEKSVKPSNNYFVFLHGSFGSSYFDKKYRWFAKELASKGLGTSLLYETSRYECKADSKLDYEKYCLSFQGKRYLDEEQDAKRIVRFYMNAILKEEKDPRLFFVGFSLGATIATRIARLHFPYLKHMYLFAPAVRIYKKKYTLWKTLPTANDIFESAQQFTGGVRVLQGTEDNVVSNKAGRELFFHFSCCRTKSLSIIKGVDHTFKKVYGKDIEAEMNKYIIDSLITGLNGF